MMIIFWPIIKVYELILFILYRELHFTLVHSNSVKFISDGGASTSDDFIAFIRNKEEFAMQNYSDFGTDVKEFSGVLKTMIDCCESPYKYSKNFGIDILTLEQFFHFRKAMVLAIKVSDSLETEYFEYLNYPQLSLNERIK